jgi:glycerol transport system ATP-binding protein
VVHFELEGLTWVSLSHGVHGFRVGDRARFAFEVERGFYFAPDGARVGG